MESIDTLLVITAGVMAAAGTVLFIVGLILETSLKYVFLMIAILGFAGRFILPSRVYRQARKEGIVWLTVLNNGDINRAREDHQKGAAAAKKFINEGSEDKNLFVYEGKDRREYRSSMYQVTVEPIRDFKCLQSHYNIIRVSVYEYESENFYHMHYVTDRDWEYTYNEYLSNEDLRPRKELNLGITECTINQFACDISSAVTGIKYSIPEYYAETGHSHFAYGWTEYYMRHTIRGMTDD